MCGPLCLLYKLLSHIKNGTGQVEKFMKFFCYTRHTKVWFDDSPVYQNCVIKEKAKKVKSSTHSIILLHCILDDCKGDCENEKNSPTILL